MTIPWFLLGRISTATLLGGTIGYERDRHGRPAGLRTHMIVALASATFMAVSTHFIEHQTYPANAHVDVDVSRIAASIVTGIGFLGGGAIMRTGLSVQGLTTAAGLWLVGAIGMAAGGGMYVVAFFATGLGLVALGVLRRFEDKAGMLVIRHLQVVLEHETDLSEVEQKLVQSGAKWELRNLEIDREHRQRTAEFDLFLPAGADTAQVIGLLGQIEGLRGARVEARAGSS